MNGNNWECIKCNLNEGDGVLKTDNKKETARFKKINKRNTRKKLISFLTALFMILGLSTSIVRAEENESYDYTYRGVEISGNRVVVNGSSASTALFKVGNPDGSISYAYCVDFDTVVENRHNYSRVNVEDANYYDDDSAKHIRAIVRNAYPFISLEEISSTLNLENLTAVEAITATQLAIWKYANAANTPSDLTGNIAAIYDYLINLDGVEGQVSVANIISKDPVIHQNGENCDVEFIFKVDGKNADGTDIDLQYTIEGQSEESNHTNLGVDEDENPLANAEFVIKNEAGEIVLKAETDENGVVKFTDLPYGKYTYQEITAPEGYVLDNTEYSFEIKENNEIIKASHRNKKENKNTTPTTNTKPINTTTNKNTSTPKTGEIGLAGVVAVLLLAGGGLLVNNRKKKDK